MQILSARAWQSQVFLEVLPSTTKPSNVDLQCSPGAIEGWLKGHFPLNTLQDKALVAPRALRKVAHLVQGWLRVGATR